MRWAYDLTGAEPIIKDIPVYDAALLDNGELLMKGTEVVGTTNGGISAITAYNATAANSAIDAIGILQESTYESGGTAPTTVYAGTGSSGVYLGKTIINPFAVYRAEVNQASTTDVACESSSTTTNIYETIATTDEAIGAWIYFTGTSTTAAIKYSLRCITDSETTYAVVPALDATPATTDVYIIIQPAHQYSLNLDPVSKGMDSVDTLTAAMSNATGDNLRIVDAWVESAGLGMLSLCGYVNRDLNISLGSMKLDSSAKFYNDIVMKDHIFNAEA